MGTRHNGLCDPLAMDTAEAWRDMGNSVPVYEVGTFSSRVDDHHTREILPVVYMRDCLITWSANIHSVE